MKVKALRYFFIRIALGIFTIWFVITITFFAMRALPGGPFLGETAVSANTQSILEAKYGLNTPILKQYVTYLSDIILRLDFGPSLKQRGRTVAELILSGMKTSFKLGLIAEVAAFGTGVTLGVIAASRRNGLADRVIILLSTVFISIPSFILGPLLLLLFSLKFMLLPANGATASGLILPIVTLAVYPAAHITQFTRTTMLDVLGQEYIRAARANGGTGVRIITNHALKNALVPIITYFSPMLTYAVTGSLVVEQIFAVPGIGRTLVNSITNRDYPVIMGVTIALAAFVTMLSLVCDFLYITLDPRIDLEKRGLRR